MRCKVLFFLIALMLAPAVCAQQVTRRIMFGSTLPATCSPAVGDTFFKTTAPVGLHHCTATNVWSYAGANTTTTSLGSYAWSSLPAAATPGRMAWLTDSFRGVVVDTGSQWVSAAGEVFNVKQFGATGAGLVDDGAGIQAAITALTAKGSGVLLFPPGTYKVFSSGTTYSSANWGWSTTVETLGVFQHLSNIAILGYGATLAIDTNGSWPYTPTARIGQMFLFEDCHNVTIDGFNGTSPDIGIATTAGVYHGVSFANFRGGCTGINIPSLTLSDWACAVRVQRESNSPDSDISSGFRLGYLDVTRSFYTVNSTWSGSDMVADLIKAERNYRTFFIYGCENVRARIISHNSIGSTDVSMSSYAGIDLKNIDIDYTNHDSDAADGYAGIRLVYLTHNYPAPVSTISNVRVKLDVKYNASGTVGPAFVLDKLAANQLPDAEDHGHVLNGLDISGIIDGTPTAGMNAIQLGEAATYGTTAAPAYDTFYHIDIHDLRIVNNTHEAPIAFSNFIKDLAGRLSLTNVSVPNAIDVWGNTTGVVTTPLSANTGAELELRGVSCTNLMANSGPSYLYYGLDQIGIITSPLTLHPVFLGHTITNQGCTFDVTWTLPSASLGRKPINFGIVAAYAINATGGGGDTVDGNPSLAISSGLKTLYALTTGAWLSK